MKSSISLCRQRRECIIAEAAKAIIFYSLGILESTSHKVKRRSSGLFLLFAPQWGGNVNADESSDSVLTPPRTKIHACKVTKAAASLRKSSTREYCDGRVDRANTLNKIPLPRSLKKLPKDIFVDGIDDNVGLSLQSDWIFFVKRLWAMIIKHPKYILCP